MIVYENANADDARIDQFLLACLMNTTGSVELPDTPVPFFDSTANREKFIQAVIADRLAPLLYSKIAGRSFVPKEIEEHFQKVYLVTAWQNTMRLEELKEILALFQSANISTVLLKGAGHLFTIYDKVGLRPMIDLDLLVKPEDISKAEALLLKRGYSYIKPRFLPVPLQNEIGLVKSGMVNVAVELHTSLFGIPHLLSENQMQWFWNKVESVERQDMQCFVLGLEAQILHLCAHLWLHHNGEGPLWLFDIYRIICSRISEINWVEVVSKAEEFKLLIPLQNVLPLLASRWQAPIPETVLKNLIQKRPTKLERIKLRRLNWTGYFALYALVIDMMSLPDMFTRFKYIWYRMFPLPTFMKDQYRFSSDILLPFFYFYRWLTSIYIQKG